MPFGNAIITALFFASYVTAITDTVWGDAERAVCCLADVANIRRTDLAINSSTVEWYNDGMHFFAYRLSGYYWIKRTITWTVTNYLRGDDKKPPQVIDKILADAFQKWAVASESRLRFPKASPGQRADIEFSFEPVPVQGGWHFPIVTQFPRSTPGALDNAGGPVRIIFCTTRQWSPKGDEREERFFDLRILALQYIGKALGLHDSDRLDARMFPQTYRTWGGRPDPGLREDDIRGLQAILNKSSSSQPTSGAHGRANSVSSRS